MKALSALLLLVVTGCDDGEGASYSVAGPTASTYGRRVKPVVATLTEIVADFSDMIAVWNATSNVTYAQSTTRELIAQTEAAAADLEQAGPAPSSYTESHDVLREATEKLQLALTRFLTYLDSGSRNETALVDANVALNQYKRLSDRYNELVG